MVLNETNSMEYLFHLNSSFLTFIKSRSHAFDDQWSNANCDQDFYFLSFEACIQIEERVELINEIEHVKITTELNDVKIKNISTETISSLPTSTIKGLLFECCDLINDIQTYNNVNESTIRHENKTNNHLTEEGHIMREGMMEKIELWKRDKDKIEENNFI